MDTGKIGRFIAAKRKEKKLTQAQFGEMLGVSNKTVSKWENGVHMPDLSLLVPISELLEISLNELLAGENLSKEELIEKAEDSVMSVIHCSKEEVKRLRKRYILTILLLITAFLGIMLALDSFIFAEVSYTEGNTAQWEAHFPKHSAYALGLDEENRPVFLQANASMKKAQSDYSDIIDYMKEEYSLLPFSKYTYKFYLPYLSKAAPANDILKNQLEGLKEFVTIYQNSFRQNGRNGTGGKDMENMMMVITFVCIVMVYMISLICTEGYHMAAYFFYKGKTKGTIKKEEAFSVVKSRRSVERQVGEKYEEILSTADRSVYHPLHFLSVLVYYGKTQAIIEWSAEKENFRARYPHLRKRGEWNAGEEVEVSYSLKHPWKYAIYDSHMWRIFLLKMIFCIGCCMIGIILFAGSI